MSFGADDEEGDDLSGTVVSERNVGADQVGDFDCCLDRHC